MRIDGTENTITIAKNTKVKSDGYRGIGVLFSYGSNQTLNQYGQIAADGEKGIGVRFDFGSGVLGAGGEYRGSYLRYGWMTDNAGKILAGENYDIIGKKKDNTPELNGPLIKEYNLAGKLSGTANAIYIGKNAFVKDINVLDGASISGDITSEWKHFNTDGAFDGTAKDKSDVLYIQYGDDDSFSNTGYEYSTYLPDLVTNLNFNADINYKGNITGKDNIRLNVKKGTLNYTGAANVVDVEIAKGASLLGSGSYMVNDMQASMPAAYSDPNMGKVINHGTIGATTGDVNITGNLVSDGNIAIVPVDNGNKVYLLNVDGKAELKPDTKATSLVTQGNNMPLLNKQYNYLTAAQGITGNIKASKLSDYVTAIGSVEGNSAFFTANQTKAFEDTTGLNDNERSVARAFNNAAPNLIQQENTVGQQAANVFYNSSSDMKKLMNSVTAAERTKLFGQTPMSGLTANSIYGRLDTNAFDGMLGVPVQVPSLDGENKTVNTNVPMTVESIQN